MSKRKFSYICVSPFIYEILVIFWICLKMENCSISSRTIKNEQKIMFGEVIIASHANVLRGSSRVPTPRTFVGEEWLRNEPVRTSAWEAKVIGTRCQSHSENYTFCCSLIENTHSFSSNGKNITTPKIEKLRKFCAKIILNYYTFRCSLRENHMQSFAPRYIHQLEKTNFCA